MNVRDATSTLRELVSTLIDSVSQGVGDGVERGRHAGTDAEHVCGRRAGLLRPAGTKNGPTEAINGRLEHLRGCALGFRNLTNYAISPTTSLDDQPRASDPATVDVG